MAGYKLRNMKGLAVSRPGNLTLTDSGSVRTLTIELEGGGRLTRSELLRPPSNIESAVKEAGREARFFALRRKHGRT